MYHRRFNSAAYQILSRHQYLHYFGAVVVVW